ncbi:putative kinase [Klebsiella pneumoniae]|uniref:Putative kinase n=1 Tax=Klebsiella pneumoniae TaxID=573 RepID=A0A378H4C7_KLEPN|nr:putative kinase [Klebsiella pneumoniae]
MTPFVKFLAGCASTRIMWCSLFTRFDAADPTKMRVQMLLCLGVGELIYTTGDIRVGSTPASTLPGFNITYFPPGADVSGDERSEKLGQQYGGRRTSSGTGLDMAQTSPDADDIIADSMTVSGSSVTLPGWIRMMVTIMTRTKTRYRPAGSLAPWSN